MNAVRRYDGTVTNKFSTIATYWVCKALYIEEATHHTSGSVAVALSQTMVRVMKAYALLKDAYGQYPTPQEVADYFKDAFDEGFSAERIGALRQYYHPVQLDASPETSTDQPGEPLITIHEQPVTNPPNLERGRAIREALEAAVGDLNPRYREVARLRYGLNPSMTEFPIDEIAKKLGLEIRAAQVLDSRIKSLLRLSPHLRPFASE